MFKNTTLLLFFTLPFSFLSAQKATHSFHFGYQYNYISADNLFQNARTATSIDSVTLLFEDALIEDSFKFKPKMGFQLGWKVGFPISKSLNFVTGIGLNYQSFKYEQVFEQLINLHTNPQTLTITQTTIGSGGVLCDAVINEPVDFTPDFDPRNEIIYLTLPFLIEAKILNDHFIIQMGTAVSTPLFSSVKRSVIRRETNEIDDGMGNIITECIFHGTEEEDNTGNGFRNFVPSINLNLAYKIWKNISAEVGITKTLTSQFSGENNFQFLSGGHIRSSLIQVSAGVRINIGKSELEVKD